MVSASSILLIRRAAVNVSKRHVTSSIGCRPLTNVARPSNSGSYHNYTKEDVMKLLNQSQEMRGDMTYSLSFGDNHPASFALSSMIEPSALMREQLEISKNQLLHQKLDTAPLPQSLQDVMRQRKRAIVVTETKKPFRVVDVNATWEGLCGYSFSEARGKTLGSLLQGPATNQVAATGLVASLLAGEKEAGAVLTNYTKDGRAFRNRIRVGPLYSENDEEITHFVGVLEELKGEEQYL